MQKCLECTVFGRVQLVMFRDFVMRKARTRGITGTVRNSPDGTVFLCAEGNEEKLRELLALVYRGPLLARVEKVDAVWKDCLGERQSFDILY
ncbi:MAG: Acylphosphatase [Parcubacteria group bacterium GW2011_GWA1_47_8]|nr:MAG: Acylphosphatase [Parcubacteria group bacterium GW2011_GWA1_47_8]